MLESGRLGNVQRASPITGNARRDEQPKERGQRARDIPYIAPATLTIAGLSTLSFSYLGSIVNGFGVMTTGGHQRPNCLAVPLQGASMFRRSSATLVLTDGRYDLPKSPRLRNTWQYSTLATLLPMILLSGLDHFSLLGSERGSRNGNAPRKLLDSGCRKLCGHFKPRKTNDITSRTQHI